NVVNSGPDATLVVTFAKDSGAGNVSGLGTQAATAGVATKSLERTTAVPAPFKLASGTVPAGALLTFTVTHAAADHIDLTGSTADLASAPTPPLSPYTTLFRSNVVNSGPDATLVVTFAKDSGAGNVSGLGTQAATAGVAT